MLLERNRISPDRWRRYVIITHNKLSTGKQDDYNLYNKTILFSSNPINAKNTD